MANTVPKDWVAVQAYDRDLSLYLRWGRRAKFQRTLLETRLGGDYPGARLEYWRAEWAKRWPRRKLEG